MPRTFITHKSNLDNRLTLAHVRFLLEALPGVDGFTVKTLELPDSLPSLPCALYGPAMGDSPVSEWKVSYKRFGKHRTHELRMIYAPMRPVRIMTAVFNDEGRLLSAFGGPAAERAPGDPTLSKDPDARRAAKAFWKVHALAGLCKFCRGDGYLGRSEISGEPCENCDGTGLEPQLGW